MIFTGRINPPPKKYSVLELSMQELDTFIAGLERKISDIDAGIAKNEPLYHPGKLDKYIPPVPGELKFWYDESTVYTESGEFIMYWYMLQCIVCMIMMMIMYYNFIFNFRSIYLKIFLYRRYQVPVCLAASQQVCLHHEHAKDYSGIPRELRTKGKQPYLF